MYLMDSYDNSLKTILNSGVSRTNKRTGIKTKSVFGMLNRYQLNTPYFPILTNRKVWPKSVFSELLWFLSGSTSNKDLQKLGCNFWNPWVDHKWEEKMGFSEDVFGPVYGFQLRHFGGYYGNGSGGPTGSINQNDLSPEDFDQAGNPMWDDQKEPFSSKIPIPHKTESVYGKGGFDQLSWIVNRIKEDSSCRRTLWTLWNPNDVASMKLPPCHMMFQVLVDDDRNLTGILYQRSADFPIGIPANIQFYSALIIMLAQQTDCKPNEFVHITADSHLYEDQLDAVEQYLELPKINSPKLEIKKAKDIFSYTIDDFILTDFNPGPKIDIPVAV